MFNTIRAEFRKLLTVRSTYITSGLALALSLFFSYYSDGHNGDIINGRGYADLTNTLHSAAVVISIFSAIIIMLLVLHEYRYNTILYSLTSTNNRLKFMFAKVFVSIVYVIVFSAIIFGASMLAAYIGLNTNARYIGLVHPDIWLNVWTIAFYICGFALFALLIAFLTRNQTASIAILLIAPTTIEPLVNLLFKSHTIHLPFTTLANVIMSGGPDSPTKSAGIVVIYLVVGWLAAVVLFLRRDAN